MKSPIFGLSALLLFLLSACAGEPSSSAPASAQTAGADSLATSPTAPATHQCQIPGTVLEDNSFWIRDQALLIVIRADSSTRDAELGDSHRLFELYDTKSCQLLQSQVLPVNVSPDYPYLLANILYNKNSQLVGIRGFNGLYVFDVASRKMLPKLSPRFATARPGADAQSGMIQHAEVWEHYLIGYAQDQGVFVYDFNNKAKPQPVLPLAEYEDPDNGTFHSLFLLPSGGQAAQGIIPYYDRESGKFSLNTLFDKPLALSTNVPKSARNNKFLVLRAQADNKAYAIDLAARKSISLPADVQTQPTQAVLKWLREN